MYFVRTMHEQGLSNSISANGIRITAPSQIVVDTAIEQMQIQQHSNALSTDVICGFMGVLFIAIVLCTCPMQSTIQRPRPQALRGKTRAETEMRPLVDGTDWRF